MKKSLMHQKARGLLRIASLRLAAKYPFHGALISSWSIIRDQSQHTMAVMVEQFQIYLFYNPAFVVSCTLDELLGVLHHEINHLVLGHVTDNPADMPDDRARIIAQEISANEFVKEPLPGQPITLAEYPDFPAGESTRRRYDRLRKLEQESTKTGQNAGGSVPNLGLHVPKSCPDVPNLVPDAQKYTAPESLDDHSLWGKAQERTLVDAAIRAAVRVAWDSLDGCAKQALDPGLRREVESISCVTVPSSASCVV